MAMNSSNLVIKKIYDEFVAIRDLASPFHPKITENDRILQLEFVGLSSRESLLKLNDFKSFEIYCGSDQLEMTIKKLDNPHPIFTLDNVKMSKFRIKYTKNVSEDYVKNLDYYFFLPEEAMRFLMTNNFSSKSGKVSLGLYGVGSFNTPIFNFFDILNEIHYSCDKEIDENTNSQIENMFKNTDQKFNKYNNVFSFKINNPNFSCPVQCEIIRMYYKSFFKLFSYKDDKISYDIRGKKKITVFADDDFSITNYQEFIDLVDFLFKDEKFLEKYIIIKNVLTRYVHDNTTFSELNTKIVEIHKTSKHYFEKYVQEDLDNFFKSRDTVYKEALSTSKAINEQNDKVNNYLNASLVSMLILAMTFIFNNFDMFNLKNLIFSFVALSIFSIMFYLYIYRSSTERYDTIKEQFDLFLNKMGIILTSEKKDITKVYLDKPYQDLMKSISRIEILIILLNVGFFIMILIRILVR